MAAAGWSGAGPAQAQTLAMLESSVPLQAVASARLSLPDQALESRQAVLQATERCAAASDGIEFDIADGFRWDAATQTATLLDLINRMRCEAGLPGLVRDERLDSAAAGHARYQVAHGVTGHGQSVSQPGFSGASAHERMRAAGFPAAGSGEVISRTHPLAVESFDSLSAAIYHRFVMLGSMYTHAGVASERAPDGMAATVIDFGAPRRIAPGGRLTVYPGAEQRAVPAGFDAAAEAPSPAAGAKQVGYPVSVQADAGSTLRVEAFELRAVNTGRIVPAAVRVGEPGAEGFEADRHLAGNESFLLPARPLDPDTEYEARFAGRIDGRAVSRTWRFRTRPPAALAGVRQVEVAAGGHVRIPLGACSADIGWSRTANLQVSVWSSGWMQVRALAAGPGVVRVHDACGRVQTVAVSVRRG